MKDFNFTEFVELTDEEMQIVDGGQVSEFLGGFSALSPSSDPFAGTFINGAAWGYGQSKNTQAAYFPQYNPYQYWY